ncbi:MAG: hypothetical protein ACTH58_04820 [Marinomonas foliarum]|uniref:hypothetical protein n=1 Tax=Marinomonas foliarum TaxID=491950 RepID=UPI003F9DB5CB
MSVEKMLDRPIAFQRVFMELGAGASGALFLSQAVYWSNRTSNSEKWFYKTIEEWTQETGLSRHEQDGARKKLKAKGVLEIIKKGIPCKTYYRVNFEKLGEILGVISATNKNAEFRQTGMPESGKLDCQEPANSCAENQQTITEITTQTTAEITSKDLLSDSDESNTPAVVDDSVSFDAKAKRELLTEAFVTFYDAYQKKSGRKSAEKVFFKIKLPNDRESAIEFLTEVMIQAKRWGDLYALAPADQKQFQPMASTWINNERWNDEELPTIRNNGQSSRDWATEMVNEEERF